MTHNTTGDTIKNLRIAKGYTQSELAKMLGVKLSTIQKYESGAIQNLKLDTLRELCRIFYVPPMALVYPDVVEKDGLKIAHHFITNLMGLNEKGAKKVIEYAEDLMKISEYRQ